MKTKEDILFAQDYRRNNSISIEVSYLTRIINNNAQILIEVLEKLDELNSKLEELEQ